MINDKLLLLFCELIQFYQFAVQNFDFWWKLRRWSNAEEMQIYKLPERGDCFRILYVE